MIKSKDNDSIKHVRALSQKKYRDEYNEYFLEGEKVVFEAINENAPIKEIFICDEIFSGSIDETKIKIIHVDRKVYESISDTVSPQGILAVMEKNVNVKNNDDIIFALDDVQDPGNVGTIIRTLDCAGIKNLIVSNKTSDVYNPKVVRSTMGAIFRVNIEMTDDLLVKLKTMKESGYQIIVATLDTNLSYTDLNFKNKAIVVIGNESKGVKKEIQDLANIKVKIPMFGKTESLNASVAASLMAYEYVRKK